MLKKNVEKISALIPSLIFRLYTGYGFEQIIMSECIAISQSKSAKILKIPIQFNSIPIVYSLIPVHAY